MRGLITVKLANEQVNYRTKFLYKNCHFSERCSSSCSKSLKKKKAVGGGGGAGCGGKGECHKEFDFFFFFKTPPQVCAPSLTKACCLRLRGNSCINELLLFFSEDTPPPTHFLCPSLLPSLFPLTQETASNPPRSLLFTHSLARWLSSLHLTGVFWEASDFLKTFYLFATTM